MPRKRARPPHRTDSLLSASTGSASTPASNNQDTRRATTTGLAVAAAGIVVFNISPLLNWVNPADDADPRTGYETDSLVPFIAYLGVGLLVALLYAGKRARRGQHRWPVARQGGTVAGEAMELVDEEDIFALAVIFGHRVGAAEIDATWHLAIGE